MNFSAISNQSVLGRMMRLPLRLVPRHCGIPILQGPLRGKRWIAGAGTHGCWLGSYELEKQRAFVEAIRTADVIYDWGANAGYYTLLGSQLAGPEGHVYSFEPLPINLAFLKRHLDLNRIGNCTIFEAALSREEGEATFQVGVNTSVGHLTADSVGSCISVKTLDVDSLVRTGTIRPPNVIKCDIEGAEFDALQGAKLTLETYLPQVFLATHGELVHRECLCFLRSIGYELRDLSGREYIGGDEIHAV